MTVETGTPIGGTPSPTPGVTLPEPWRADVPPAIRLDRRLASATGHGSRSPTSI